MGNTTTHQPVQIDGTTSRPVAETTSRVEVALLTGGQDPHYAFGLSSALTDAGVYLDVIGSDLVERPELHLNSKVRFLALHGNRQAASVTAKLKRTLAFYCRLFKYVASTRAKTLHILWNNNVELFDRTLLMIYYRAAGKKVVLTAHNVNAGRRDKQDSWLNRATLTFQYRLAEHIFVHTAKMKGELVRGFGVKGNRVTVIPYGINNAVPMSALTREEARQNLGLGGLEKVILYFGAIKQYKGLEHLVAAFQKIAGRADYRLIIAGERKKGCEEYWRAIKDQIQREPSREKVLQMIKFIPDTEVEVYFKAADVAVLPYTEIFQSGILFLTFAYGLPVIATDVGSFSEDVDEGTTGLICKPEDPEDLAATIERYFSTRMYTELESRREKIRDFVGSRHSWRAVAELTKDVYLKTMSDPS
jgi:D-inositol-3-phosphate glycosyltransferase